MSLVWPDFQTGSRSKDSQNYQSPSILSIFGEAWHGQQLLIKWWHDQWLCELRRAAHTHSYFLTFTSLSLCFLHSIPLLGSNGALTHPLRCWNEWRARHIFLCNYRFLSGLASLISQSLLQVQQLLYYCNHGDLFAVWFSSGNVFMDESGRRISERARACLRECVCECVFVVVSGVRSG